MSIKELKRPRKAKYAFEVTFSTREEQLKKELSSATLLLEMNTIYEDVSLKLDQWNNSVKVILYTNLETIAEDIRKELFSS